MENSNIMVVIDGSYFIYYTLFGAETEFEKQFPDEYKSLIKPAKETDQDNLPNLLNSENYKIVLKRMTIKRLSTIDWILKQNFANELDLSNKIDFIFTLENGLDHSFRKELCPEYKAQRTTIQRKYKLSPIKHYIRNVIFKELELETKYGYKTIEVESAEGDDIIACLMNNFNDYMLKVLFSSDKDFLQLESGVRQFDLGGKEVKRIVCDQELNPKDFLLFKTILGDKSDNIPNVFKGVGEKKTLNLINDRELLKEKLKENQDSAKQFLLNKKLISFSEIPASLNMLILEKINEMMFKFSGEPKREFADIELMEL